MYFKVYHLKCVPQSMYFKICTLKYISYLKILYYSVMYFKVHILRYML